MSDIAKCRDIHCPSKEKCIRFTAVASESRQSYGSFNREEDAINCNNFVDNNICQYCSLENGNHKLSCPVIKITMII
jgi:hypothetical protein